MIYMVENEIADASRENAWNAWYTRHVTTAFHSVPGWRTGQRFVAVAHSRPRYRAMYTVDDAAVLSSPAYLATSGGRVPDQWRSMVADLRRNLADGDWMPSVPMEKCLVVVDTPVANADFPGIALEWWNVVGLDRSIERRAIAVVERATGEALAHRALPRVGVYNPMFEQYVV